MGRGRGFLLAGDSIMHWAIPAFVALIFSPPSVPELPRSVQRDQASGSSGSGRFKGREWPRPAQNRVQGVGVQWRRAACQDPSNAEHAETAAVLAAVGHMAGSPDFDQMLQSGCDLENKGCSGSLKWRCCCFCIYCCYSLIFCYD